VLTRRIIPCLDVKDGRVVKGVRFAALPARDRVQFGGLGTAQNATVTLAAGARARSVIVNQRGRVRVQ